MPLVHALSVNASARIDSYSDFGDTTNYKMGFTYDPFAALSVRGSVATSFAAPSLRRYLGAGYAFHLHAPTHRRATPTCHQAHRRPMRCALHQHTGRQSAAGAGKRAGHGRSGGDFHPTTEFGFDLTGLLVKVTAWHVKFSDQIGLILNNPGLLFSGAYPQYLYAQPDLGADPGALSHQLQCEWKCKCRHHRISRTGSGVGLRAGRQCAYILYDLRRNNLGQTVIDGLDIEVHYVTDIEGFGTLGAGFSTTINTTNENTPARAWPPSIS